MVTSSTGDYLNFYKLKLGKIKDAVFQLHWLLLQVLNRYMFLIVTVLGSIDINISVITGNSVE